MSHRIVRFGKDNRFLIIFIILMVCFRSALADWNTVPTGSMNPTIVEGDRIFVNKVAYDVRIPLTGIFLKRISNPERNDIVTFDSEKVDETLVKRVIGLPGDTVEMRNNMLIVNNIPATYTVLQSDQNNLIVEEQIGESRHRIKVSRHLSYFSSFGPVTVPENQYLVLGDNRDNSADSRVHGFIPRAEIRGRSQLVVLSLNYEKFYFPRSNRFMKDLD